MGSKGKVNCWEFMRCGRQPGGKNVPDQGVCPAPLETSGNGINGGINGGRCCWAIAGTLCYGDVHGNYAMKIQDCMDCNFFWAVADEENEFTAYMSGMRRSGRKPHGQ